MKTLSTIPALALLALFAASPASALTPASNLPVSAGVEESGGGIVIKAMSADRYHCRTYRSRHAQARCYQKHGLTHHRM
jgi:hypothetical protein